MREPLTKFPKRATGQRQTREIIEECRRMLTNRTLSPEMQTAMKQRIQQLEEELRMAAVHQVRDDSMI